MPKRLRYSLLFILCIIMASFMIPTPALATDLPDSTPTAQFYVYRNLLETGDWLILIDQNIPYSVTPAESTAAAYMWRLLDTDNVTELGTAIPYPWNENGYGYAVTSMYFNAANVTAAGMVWNTAYPIILSGSPIHFTTPPNYVYSLSMSDYNTLTATADIQSALASRILVLAANLDIQWGLGATYSLVNETETGTVLSTFGEAYFRGAIYGLQGLCPQVFAYVISNLDLTPRTWTNTYVTTLQNQYTGTWVQTAKAAGAALFGTTYDLTGLIVSLLVAAALLIITIVLSGDAWHGLCDARTGLIVMTRLGFFDLGFLGLLAALAVVYGASRMWSVMK